MATRLLSLTENWRLRPAQPREAGSLARRQIPTPLSRQGWIEASVPGHSLADLERAGVLPALHEEDNEKAAWPYETQDFLYKTSFLLPDEWAKDLGRPGRRFDLEFESLDTFAVVFLNGQRVGESANAFLPARFDVSGAIHHGENVLLVHFEPSLRLAMELQRTGGNLAGAHDSVRMHVRRPQFATGWDNAARLSGCGITGPVHLHRVSGIALDGLHAVVKGLSTKEAKVAIEVELDVIDAAEYHVEAIVSRMEPHGSGKANEKTEVWAKRKAMNLQAGRFRYSENLTIEEPALWWPQGMERGRRTLYSAAMTVKRDGETVAEISDVFGLRKVELFSETESGDNPFTFKVNGEPVFSRGAIVLPPEMFWAGLPESRWRALVDNASTANINMLRVWGGGTYLPRAFYRRCDELGIMVWQDFMFSQAEHPETKEFWALCQAEARHQVKRLRNHPALVLWCGNDASDWLAHRNGNDWKNHTGSRIFTKLLPTVCQNYDPARPYWRSSPSGGAEPNAPAQGDHHHPDLFDGTNSSAGGGAPRIRFLSEFGCQSLPSEEVLRKYCSGRDTRLSDPGYATRQKHPGGNERILRQVASLVRLPESYEELVYLSQWVQAHALASGMDRMRAAKPVTMGALVWHFNDCWPGITWSIVDHAGRPKLAFWALREACAPLTVALLSAEDGVRPVVLNDGPSWQPPREVVCRLKSYALDGTLLHFEDHEVSVPGGGKVELGLVSHTRMKVTDPAAAMVAAELCEGEHMLAGRLHAAEKPARMRYVEPQIKAQLDCVVANRRAILLLRSDVIIQGVELALEDMPDARIRFENGFDIWPSREVWVQIDAPRDIDSERLSESLRFRCLNDATAGRSVLWRPLSLQPSDDTRINPASSYAIPTARVRLSDIVRKLEG